MSKANRTPVSFWMNTAGLLLATSCLTPVNVFAACAPSPAASGSTITCSGTDTVGVGTGAEDNVTLTVNKGASIVDSGEGFTIQLGDNAKVVNNGSIGDNGVFLLSGGTLHNRSTGTIEGVDAGVVAGNGSSILNDGIILSAGTAVRITESTLTNTGTISAIGNVDPPQAIELSGGKIINKGEIYVESNSFTNVTAIGGNGEVENYGNIHVVQTGDGWATAIGGGLPTVNNASKIQVESASAGYGINMISGDVVNSGDIIIDSAFSVGIRANYGLTLNNSGNIKVTSDSATGVNGGGQAKITNSGTITAEGTGQTIGIIGGGAATGTLTVDNSGTISADVAITVNQNENQPRDAKITNSGTINGDIVLLTYADTLINKSQGKITGDIVMSGGNDLLVNGGTIVGKIDLGEGDDAFFEVNGATVDKAAGGAGFDTIGFYAAGKDSGILSVSGDFEAAGVFTDPDATFTILPETDKSSDILVRLYGSGDVVNEATLGSVSKDYPTVEMLGNGLSFNNQGDIKGRVGVALSGNGETFTNNANLSRDFMITDNSGNLGFIQDRGLGNTIINNANISSKGFATESIMIGGDDLVAASLTYFSVGDVVEMLQAVPKSTLINNGVIEGENKAVSGGGVVTGSYAPVDIINNGDIGQITSYVRRGGVSILNTKDAKIGYTDVYQGLGGINIVLQTTTTDEDRFDSVQKYKPATFDTGVKIVNELGASIDNGIQISGYAATLWLGYFGKNVTFSIDIENELGGSILADNKGEAIAIRPLVIVGDFADTVKFVTVIDNSGYIGGDIIGGDLAETLINRGSVEGDIMLGAGNDIISLETGAMLIGNIDGGSGTDEIKSSGDGSIDGKVTNIEALKVTGGLLAADFGTGSSVVSTSVTGGTLDVNGPLATTVAVGQDGTLGGGGAITGNVTNAGIVAPGNSIGTLSVAGNYTQTATGQFLVELGPSSADKLAVSGTAALDGILSTGLVATDYAALEGKSYTVLTAGSISGALDNLGTVQQGFWTLNIAQAGGAVNVTVTDVNVPIGATQPLTSPLSGMLRYIVNGGASGGGGGIEIGGDNNNLPIGGVIEGTGEGVPPDAGRMSAQNDDAGGQQAASLDYDDMGDWESKAASLTDNWSGMGDRTPAMAMPKTGTAEFAGTTKGELTETASGTPEAFVVEGNVLLTANFASGLVNADFTDMEKIDAHGVAAAWVDFRARMSIADGTSEFAGTAGTDDGVWSGKAKGGFYGDDNGMPGHAAGLWNMSSPLGRALGGFMAKRQ